MRLCTLLLAAALLCLPAAATAATGCAGKDLIAALPEAERAALEARTAAAPYPEGNLWQATRGGQSVTLVGTYHLDDPRHAAIVAALEPAVASAALLLVEAGPEEERALMDRVGRDPSAILLPEGPSLLERLPPEDWAALAQAMRDRGMPPFMAARFRPWYVMTLLSVPPCAIEAVAGRDGLDRRLIDVAVAAGKPVRALEPWDTALRLLDGMDYATQLSLLRTTLALEAQAEDQMATLTAAYFAGRSRVIWEFMRQVMLDRPDADPTAIEAEFAAMEETLMAARNRAWLPVIEAAAAEGPVVAAFGALHLSGDEGVLNLMAGAGWTLAPLPWPVAGP